MSALFGLSIDPAAHARVQQAIVDAVAASYVRVKSVRTDAEDRRRVRMCIEFFRTWRGDLNWSVARCCDQLAVALVAKLIDAPFHTNRRSWRAG